MVLAHLGISLTEAEIRRRCGHTAAGMLLNEIANGLRDLPVAVAYETGCGTDDLIDAIHGGLNPIVGIDLRPVDGIFAFHAVVVAGITARQVSVYDPQYPRGPRSIGLNTFELAWYGADGELVIIGPEPLILAI
jgi:ABC-type bacteriocin/lantibiotic exporter with double-glycine peptidase domain